MMGSLLSIEHFPLKKESPMKFFYQRNAKRGILAAVIIHALALGTYWGVWWYQEQSRVYATRILGLRRPRAAPGADRRAGNARSAGGSAFPAGDRYPRARG